MIVIQKAGLAVKTLATDALLSQKSLRQRRTDFHPRYMIYFDFPNVQCQSLSLIWRHLKSHAPDYRLTPRIPTDITSSSSL
jgi:hypothetical protein